jgi:hypothetical protein
MMCPSRDMLAALRKGLSSRTARIATSGRLAHRRLAMLGCSGRACRGGSAEHRARQVLRMAASWGKSC